MIALADLQSLGIGLEPDDELVAIRQAMRGLAGYGPVRAESVVTPFTSWPPTRSGFAGVLDDVDGALRGAVRSATFSSNFSPPVTWDPSAPSSPSTGAGPSLGTIDRFLQPTLDLDLVTGQRVTIAPAGRANPDGYKVVVAGVVVAVVGSFAAAVLLGYWLGRRSRRRR